MSRATFSTFKYSRAKWKILRSHIGTIPQCASLLKMAAADAATTSTGDYWWGRGGG